LFACVCKYAEDHFGILEFAYFFLSREILLIATDEMVSTHNALDVLGRTSINALQSSIKTHPLASLKNAHKVNAVKDRLTKLNHFTSRCRNVQTTFKTAVIIATIPNNNHIICSSPNSSLTNFSISYHRKSPHARTGTAAAVPVFCFHYPSSISIPCCSISAVRAPWAQATK